MNFAPGSFSLDARFFLFLQRNLVGNPQSGQNLGPGFGWPSHPLVIHDMFRGDGLALSPHNVHSIRRVDWDFFAEGGNGFQKLCVFGLQHGKHLDRYKVFEVPDSGGFTLECPTLACTLAWVLNSGIYTGSAQEKHSLCVSLTSFSCSTRGIA